MSRQIVTKEEAIEMKRARVPLYEARDKVKTMGLDPNNFHYKYIDIGDPDEVDRHLEASYVFVCKDGTYVGEQVVDTVTGTSSIRTLGGGKGVTLGLMCIPIDLYLLDQAGEERKNKAREQGMFRDINATADKSKGNIGTGVTQFGSQISALPGEIPA